ncbi:putative cinnamyl alcohol dehydrogenase 9 [Quercus suber]|uniref:Cinnamyl alcohol dehydrogenase 9 n=1 Tax=Quercus suber TaxID=58331 RepID=A0AAW0KIH9_QUESU
MAKSPEEEHPQKAFGWAAKDSSGLLSPFHFSRRETGDGDVTIKILYCGVCHSDLHNVKNEWGFTMYPVVPGCYAAMQPIMSTGENDRMYCSQYYDPVLRCEILKPNSKVYPVYLLFCWHEIVGTVTKTRKNVKKFKVGDRVGVGVLVDSCKRCESCQQDLENYCPQMILTYNSYSQHGTKTYGGNSDIVVVNEHYVLRFPENLPPDAGAPLLCAGITVYSPMKYYGMTEPGKHLGVAGLGGLGHVAVKIGEAFGLKVTVISTSPKKEDEAINRLGADSFLVSSDPAKMKAAINTMDYIIDTVSAVHPLAPLISLLKLNGKLITVGRKLVGGSDVGGIKETQEMLDFCAKHGITADIELIKMGDINTAMERLAKSDVKYRFVIDVASS